MKETIGSTWLTGIIITFIAIFSAFLAYSISYTKAFRVKNEILNIIEKNEGFTTSSNQLDNISDAQLSKDTSTEGTAFRFIKSIGYNYTKIESINPCSANDTGTMQKGGYCLAKYCQSNGEITKVYYKVTTYISLSIPVINIGITLPVSGETKALNNDLGNYSDRTNCIID